MSYKLNRFSSCMSYNSNSCFSGVRSTSFKSDLLTIGSGVGVIMFYDLRAQRYLESGINSSRTVTLRTSRGYIVSTLWDISNYWMEAKLLKFWGKYRYQKREQFSIRSSETPVKWLQRGRKKLAHKPNQHKVVRWGGGGEV